MGTPKKVPINFGNPHIGAIEKVCQSFGRHSRIGWNLGRHLDTFMRPASEAEGFQVQGLRLRDEEFTGFRASVLESGILDLGVRGFKDLPVERFTIGM